jgi:hypothetical protein
MCHRTYLESYLWYFWWKRFIFYPVSSVQLSFFKIITMFSLVLGKELVELKHQNLLMVSMNGTKIRIPVET